MKENYVYIYMAMVAVLLLIVFFNWQNNSLQVSRFVHESRRIPSSFNNYNIIHISDLHNKRFGSKQYKILDKIKKDNPDIILITGDIVDRRRYSLTEAVEFALGAVEIAPVYYVAGNHEAWSFKYDEVEAALKKAGVTVLNDEKVIINKGGSNINIIGLMDAAFQTKENATAMNLESFKENLKGFSDPKDFSLLLSHRPEVFDLYVASNIDLVFSGHAHGGQFRLPFIGGLYSPNQGIFPTYTSGKHSENQTTMFVSRGLGNSQMPIRLFNKPEIIKVTLKVNK